MSVRRLAVEQPESFAFSKGSEAKVKFWLNKYPEERRASAVIPLLWIAQKQDNWISEPAMREIAARCDMPYIRVYEVATFYTMFNLAPTGQHLIQLCGTTPCWLRGADALKAVCEKKIGPKGRDHVSADGKLAWEEVECLGACANAPMVQISNTEGDLYYEDLTREALEQMLDDLAADKPIKAGPVSGRSASEPTGAKHRRAEGREPVRRLPGQADHAAQHRTGGGLTDVAAHNFDDRNRGPGDRLGRGLHPDRRPQSDPRHGDNGGRHRPGRAVLHGREKDKEWR
jgi:NADH-quinone oxidoreductase E subunit